MARRSSTSPIPSKPQYLGDLVRTKGANMSSWREIKTYKNYALIVSDGSGDHHGIQIFDLTQLRNVTTPKHFTEDAHFDAGSIHDIAVNQESGFAYAVGTASGGERCGGGLLMVDMHTPLQPKFAGCFADAARARADGLHARRAVRDVPRPGQALRGSRDLHGVERDDGLDPGRDRQVEGEGRVARGLPDARLHAPGVVHG